MALEVSSRLRCIEECDPDIRARAAQLLMRQHLQIGDSNGVAELIARAVARVRLGALMGACQMGFTASDCQPIAPPASALARWSSVSGSKLVIARPALSP